MNPPESTLPRRRDVSVIAPLSPAIERTKRMLFQPFDLGKWFTIGFCAWLAALAEGGGFHVNFNFPGGGGRRSGPVDFQQGLHEARDFFTSNLHWIIPVAVGVLVLGLALWMLLLWLNARGKFMLLHCIALDRAEVAVPWREFARQGNSLFGFNAAVGLAGALLLLPLLGVIGWMIYRMIDCSSVLARELTIAIGAGLAFLLLALVAGLIHKLTTDFVVPIMYLRRCGCLKAWREFWRLFAGRLGDFVIYLLFQIVIGLLLGLITLFVMFATCCCCCLLLVPYLGTVILLPLPVFARSYALLYLAQHGPAYDVFPHPSPAPESPPKLG